MTQLMEKAYTRITQLPQSEQDSIASLILDELEDDERWNQQFASSSSVLSQLGKKAQAELRAGKTLPLDPDNL